MIEALSTVDFGSTEAAVVSNDFRAVISHDFAALEVQWTELEIQAGCTIFQSYAWCSTWAEAAHRAGCREMPYVVTVWKGNRLVLLWPFVMRRLGPFRVLHSFGDPATQYSDALTVSGGERDRWLEVAWKELRSLKGIDAVLLKGVRDDAAIAPFVASRCGDFVTRRAEAPFADFRPNAANPIRRRSGRTRNVLQRHLRNLAKHGDTEFETVTDTAGRVEAMRDALRLKEAWLSRTGKFSAGYSHPANSHFMPDLAACPDFVVARLKVGGETAAIEAGLLRNGSYASLIQSYDGRYAAHRPGYLLFWHMVEHAAEFGIEVLDFLAPAYPHKRDWANGEMPVRDYVIPIWSGGRVIVYFIRHVRPRIKMWLERLSKMTAA